MFEGRSILRRYERKKHMRGVAGTFIRVKERWTLNASSRIIVLGEIPSDPSHLGQMLERKSLPGDDQFWDGFLAKKSLQATPLRRQIPGL